MLYYLIPSFKENKLIKLYNKFVSSPLYVLLFVCLTLLSSIGAYELYVYPFFVLFGCIIPLLICEDMTSLIAPLMYGYVTFSYKNNNTSGEGLLAKGHGRGEFIVLGIIIITCLIIRLVYDLIRVKGKKYPKFSIGLLLLGLAYALGGIFSGYYSNKTLIFGLIEFACIAVPYFYLSFTINFDKFRESYLAYVMLGLGIIVSSEIAYCYLTLPKDVEFSRSLINFGWGCYNNIGGEMAMCLASPIYLASKNKYFAPLFVLISLILLAFTFLSQSRGAMLMGTIVYTASTIALFLYGTTKERFYYGAVYILLIGIIVSLVIIFKDKLYVLFKDVINTILYSNDLDEFSSNRLEIYREGISQFKKNKMFGLGFYECSAFAHRENMNLGDFMPARYHDTYVQLLASTGLFGLIAYIYHRVETLISTIFNGSKTKTFIFFSILGLILTAILDCHFFNLGPGLQYSILLVGLDRLKGRRDNKKLIK